MADIGLGYLKKYSKYVAWKIFKIRSGFYLKGGGNSPIPEVSVKTISQNLLLENPVTFPQLFFNQNYTKPK